MFEIVHTVTDFYDRPRGGVADLEGAAHLYEAEWDFGLDDYSDTFLLMPIDSETLALALEDWAIFRRWEDAFYRGLAYRDSHPALPYDGDRHKELKRLLTDRLKADPGLSVRKLGEFRLRTDTADRPRGAFRDLEVRWYDPAEQDAAPDRDGE